MMKIAEYDVSCKSCMELVKAIEKMGLAHNEAVRELEQLRQQVDEQEFEVESAALAERRHNEVMAKLDEIKDRTDCINRGW